MLQQCQSGLLLIWWQAKSAEDDLADPLRLVGTYTVAFERPEDGDGIVTTDDRERPNHEPPVVEFGGLLERGLADGVCCHAASFRLVLEDGADVLQGVVVFGEGERAKDAAAGLAAGCAGIVAEFEVDHDESNAGGRVRLGSHQGRGFVPELPVAGFVAGGGTRGGAAEDRKANSEENGAPQHGGVPGRGRGWLCKQAAGWKNMRFPVECTPVPVETAR